ncbi:MAG: hypothetical protein K2N74_01300, partial [Clostridiales bacterium]|nr:hypothetical protein [Clostridiales bacterium]
MILTLKNINLKHYEKESALVKLCEKKLRAPCAYFKILKKSLDARDKSNIHWVYTVECSDRPVKEQPPVFEQIKKSAPAVYVAGSGPAGLFCAIRLIEHGMKPIVLERGKKVEERERDILNFQQSGVLDPNSNVQFGEGGAGTFSDGKLNTQTNHPLNK